jgi:hypothetical protein
MKVVLKQIGTLWSNGLLIKENHRMPPAPDEVFLKRNNVWLL